MKRNLLTFVTEHFNMRKLTFLLLCLLLTCGFASHALAADKPKTTITSVKQKGNEVVFTLTSARKFIVGGNEYILHIGDKTFKNYRHISNSPNRGVMAFLIPADDYNALAEGSNIYLTYGRIASDEEDEVAAIEELAKANNRRVWPLGKLNKKMTTK
jgi:hypothetical protein